jgi:hypothetical protein
MCPKNLFLESIVEVFLMMRYIEDDESFLFHVNSQRVMMPKKKGVLYNNLNFL